MKENKSTFKTLLLKEAQKLEMDKVELDSVLENLELDEESKADLTEAFIGAVNRTATSLSESHIQNVVEMANAHLQEELQKLDEAKDQKLQEQVDKYLVAIGDKWMTENKEALENRSKANMFESLVVSLKEAFIQHNVKIPDESIDVVATLEEAVVEAEERANTLYEEKFALQENLNSLKKANLIKEMTNSLTESQKEDFAELAESISLKEGEEEKFTSKLKGLVSVLENKLTNTQSEDLTKLNDLTEAEKVQEDVVHKSNDKQTLTESTDSKKQEIGEPKNKFHQLLQEI